MKAQSTLCFTASQDAGLVFAEPDFGTLAPMEPRS